MIALRKRCLVILLSFVSDCGIPRKGKSLSSATAAITTRPSTADGWMSGRECEATLEPDRCLSHVEGACKDANHGRMGTWAHGRMGPWPISIQEKPGKDRSQVMGQRCNSAINNTMRGIVGMRFAWFGFVLVVGSWLIGGNLKVIWR